MNTHKNTLERDIWLTDWQSPSVDKPDLFSFNKCTKIDLITGFINSSEKTSVKLSS